MGRQAETARNVGLKIVTGATVIALGVVPLAGCQQKTVSTSNNDKYEVFQTDNATFTPAAADQAAATIGDECTITATGWWAKDCYIHWGIKIQNPNANLIARDVVIGIKSYDAAGELLSQDTSTISFIGPETTIGFAGKSGNGQKPETVEITVEKTTTWQDAESYVEPLFVASVEEQDKGYYRYEYTGGITNNTGSYVSTAPISILLEDEDGNILAGYTGSTKRIKAGRTKDYQITINTAPDHAKVEVFADWSTINDTVNDELSDED